MRLTFFSHRGLCRLRRLGMVGLVGLLSVSCAGLIGRDPKREFRAATYNIHYAERGLPGLVAAVKGLDADVVAMQEVLSVGNSPVSQIMATALGYNHVASVPYVNYGKSQWVLAIVSWHPIIAHDEIQLGNSRRALRAVVSINGQAVEFITLHLTPISGTLGGMDQVRRRGEARRAEITDLLQWLGSPKRPRIVLGDFNMLRGTMGFYDLNEYNLLSALYNDADGGWLPTNSDTFPIPADTRKKIGEKVPVWLVPHSITLDYMFISDGLTVLETDVVDEVDASDHWPLVGRFRIAKP